MKYIWTKKNNNKKKIEKISKKYDLKKSVANILLNRIESPSKINQFLNPKLEYLYSPFEFKDMEKSVRIIKDYIQNSKKILIYGDYDVDGITGTSLLVKVLQKLDADLDWIIPNRIEDGYGVNSNIIKEKINDFDLLITVDCGITANNEIKYLKEQGKKVIITDHHLSGKKLPKADAILNPKIYEYSFKSLSGVGVAYKLGCALTNTYLKEYLDLVAVGTVADIVPLLNENRIIVSNGLRNINNKVFKKLIKINELPREKIKPAHISFVIGPRINSVGRLSDANKIVELFVEEDTKKIDKWIEKIEKQNNKRKEIENNIYREAEEKIKEINMKNSYVLVLKGEKWHSGVIGIVASRLSEKYNRPVLMITNDKNNLAKGSGRSIDSINLYKLVTSFHELFHKLGGHHQAIGFSLKEENIKKLRKKLNQKIKNEIDKYHLIPKIKIDSQIGLEKISKKLIEDINRLEPFGYKNPKPLYEIRSVQIKKPYTVGSNNNHLKLWFKNEVDHINAIGFNMGEYKNYITHNIDLVGYLEINRYKGKEYLQIKIKDIRNHINKMADIERKNFVYVYNLIKKNKKIHRRELFNKSNSSKLFIDFIIKVFEELDIIFRLGDIIHINENCPKEISFENSKIYKYVLKGKDV